MKLYSKQLSSLAALRGEKIRLRTELRHAEKPELNPFAMLGADKLSVVTKGGLMGVLIELFSAKSEFKTALAIIKPLLSLFGRKRRRYGGGWYDYRPRKKSVVTKLAGEIAVGYLTGKAVQLAILGAGILLRQRKHKKAMKHPVL